MSEEYIYQLLVTSVISLAAIMLYLTIAVLINRYLAYRKKKRTKRLRSDYTDLILRATDQEEARQKLFREIEDHPGQIPVITEITHQILSDINGQMAQQVVDLLTHEQIMLYHKKLFRSRSDKKRIRALVYFRDCRQFPESERQNILNLLDHKHHYMAHAAASVILSSSQSQFHFETLIRICSRSDDKRFTTIELFWHYWNNQSLSSTQKQKCFQRILASNEISVDLKALLVETISSFDDYHFGIYFLEILECIESAGQLNEQEVFVISLVNALANSEYKPSLNTISSIYRKGNTSIKKACLKAFANFSTRESIKYIRQAFLHEGDQIRKYISYITNRIPQLSESISLKDLHTKLKLVHTE